MIRLLLSTLYVTLFFNCFAQQAPIALVSSNGTTRLTSSLDSAAILAQDNDIIYLPGGTFAGNSGGINYFNNKVTIIGVGHNPDSSVATGITKINGAIGFYFGAEGSTLDGVFVSDNIYVTSNVKVFRSSASNIIAAWATAENILIEKCVIRSTAGVPLGYYAYNYSTIKNSIISGDFANSLTGNVYQNCIMLLTGECNSLLAGNLNVFKNCTFTGITSWTGSTNCFFQNNLFASAALPPLTDPGNASNNKLNQSAAATFVNQTGSNYGYDQNYRIKPTSAGHNGGIDGQDVGVYGGTSAWVDGNVPPNPHIRTKNVDASTGAGGTLRVRFNVGAQ